MRTHLTVPVNSIHFTVCSTNPEVMQKAKDRQKKLEHNRQRDAAAEERATRAVDQRTTQKPQPLNRTTPDDHLPSGRGTEMDATQ